MVSEIPFPVFNWFGLVISCFFWDKTFFLYSSANTKACLISIHGLAYPTNYR